jgi:EAL domain-containing protein (putative c-di-GMP-specific phosphodiesterase class I)
LALAAALGCTFGQGYYIARPMPAEVLLSWLLERAGTGVPDERVPAAGHS